MKITPEMMAEDERRWGTRDVITELGYCGNCMRDRKNMTNLDIRFYAYLMRKAHDMLKAREPRVMTLEEVIHSKDWIWYQWKNTHCGWAVAVNCDGKWIEWEDSTTDQLCKYGEKWRCWTSRPTPELMRDTKWEESNNE